MGKTVVQSILSSAAALAEVEAEVEADATTSGVLLMFFLPFPVMIAIIRRSYYGTGHVEMFTAMVKQLLLNRASDGSRVAVE
jgi:hypothetical protein